MITILLQYYDPSMLRPSGKLLTSRCGAREPEISSTRTWQEPSVIHWRIFQWIVSHVDGWHQGGRWCSFESWKALAAMYLCRCSSPSKKIDTTKMKTVKTSKCTVHWGIQWTVDVSIMANIVEISTANMAEACWTFKHFWLKSNIEAWS